MSTDDDKPSREAIPLVGLILMSPEGVSDGLVSLPADLADQVAPAIIKRHRVRFPQDDPEAI
jgi:hypothetical protein